MEKKKLIELTVADLYKSTVDAFPNTKERQYAIPYVNITNIRYIPFKQSRVLRVEATAISNGHTYRPSIQIKDIYFEDEAGVDTTTIKGADGNQYHIHPAIEGQNSVLVRCNCLDFYHRFASYDYQNDALDGKPFPPYRRKTQDRPLANPAQSPGFCKHVIKLFEVLKDMNIISG